MFSPTIVSLQLRGSPGSPQNGKLRICLVPLGPEWGQPFRSWERKHEPQNWNSTCREWWSGCAVPWWALGFSLQLLSPPGQRRPNARPWGKAEKRPPFPASIVLNTSQSSKGCILREQRLPCLLLWHNPRKGPLCSLSKKPNRQFFKWAPALLRKILSCLPIFSLHPSTRAL